MNQDSFRSLLSSKPREASSSRGQARSSTKSTSGAKSKTIDASQPAFKPRKLKPDTDSKYRDRATERRLGQAHDFAHVEAVLNEFEKQAKDGANLEDIEEKRKYLGGDSDHSVLVKGLDFALLQQNKARAALANDTVDDDTLEQAFTEVVAKPKKRTREDLLRELKEKRGGGNASSNGTAAVKSAEDDSSRALEEAKQKGKFKPIGFKPIGESSEGRKKKKVKGDGGDGERKKKKRKTEGGGEAETKEPPVQPSLPSAPPTTEPEPIDDDVDIFAGAGEYEGLELDDDDEDDRPRQDSRGGEDTQVPPPQKWISMDEEPIFSQKQKDTATPQRSESPERRETSAKLSPPLLDEEGEGMEVDERPMRLVPLASSALPDVKELLEMDRASSSWSKNKKKKDKKKAAAGGGDPTKATDAKIERDYQRLKAYTDKNK